MASGKDIEQIEKELSSIFAQMKKNSCEIQQCEKKFEETLNAIKKKCSAESEQLNKIVQKYQELFLERPKLVNQSYSSLVNWNKNYKFQSMKDIEDYCQTLQKYRDEITDFLNGR